APTSTLDSRTPCTAFSHAYRGSATTGAPAIRRLIPARIDRLPWSRFHTRIVAALGVAWIPDGLEITIASNVGLDLTLKSTLHMSARALADIASWYLVGEVIGDRRCGRGHRPPRPGRHGHAVRRLHGPPVDSV